MRKGERWYYKTCEILYNLYGDECVYFRGFGRTHTNNGRAYPIGIFETVDKNLDLNPLVEYCKDLDLTEFGILDITVRKEISGFRNCIIVWLG